MFQIYQCPTGKSLWGTSFFGCSRFPACLQHTEGQQQIQPGVAVVQVEVPQLLQLAKTVGEGGAVDNQRLRRAGDAALVEQISPQGLGILLSVWNDILKK